MHVEDFPKLHAPFVRDDKGNVTPVVNPGYEWVFDDPRVLAVEKLDGTNVSVLIQNGQLVGMWNRVNRVTFPDGNQYILDAIKNAYHRGYLELPDGQHFGEAIGPHINGNRHRLDAQLWVPFERIKRKWSYKSFHKYPKTFEGWSEWFKSGLFSLFAADGGFPMKEQAPDMVEGLVFVHADGQMAKLRRDMFDWYSGPRHKESE